MMATRFNTLAARVGRLACAAWACGLAFMRALMWALMWALMRAQMRALTLALPISIALVACGGGGTTPITGVQLRPLSAEFTTRKAVSY